MQEGRLVFAGSVMLDQSVGNRQGWKQMFFWGVKRSNLHEHACKKKCTLRSKNQRILDEIFIKQVPKEEKIINIILLKIILNCELH